MNNFVDNTNCLLISSVWYAWQMYLFLDSHKFFVYVYLQWILFINVYKVRIKKPTVEFTISLKWLF